MQNLVKQMNKQSMVFFINLSIVVVAASLVTFILMDDSRIPLDALIIIGVSMILLVTLLTSFVLKTEINKLTMPTFVMIMIILPASTLITDNTLIYSEDCNQINVINPNIDVVDCINFIIDNPDSTGMQVIEAFETETEMKKDIDVSILTRQFNP